MDADALPPRRLSGFTRTRYVRPASGRGADRGNRWSGPAGIPHEGGGVASRVWLYTYLLAGQPMRPRQLVEKPSAFRTTTTSHGSPGAPPTPSLSSIDCWQARVVSGPPRHGVTTMVVGERFCTSRSHGPPPPGPGSALLQATPTSPSPKIAVKYPAIALFMGCKSRSGRTYPLSAGTKEQLSENDGVTASEHVETERS